jgi:hypothetical protein
MKTFLLVVAFVALEVGLVGAAVWDQHVDMTLDGNWILHWDSPTGARDVPVTFRSYATQVDASWLYDLLDEHHTFWDWTLTDSLCSFRIRPTSKDSFVLTEIESGKRFIVTRKTVGIVP